MRLRLLAVGLALSAVATGCGSCSNDTPNSFQSKGPILESITPAQGPSTGGTVVLLRGERISPEAKVLFGGREAVAVTIADARTLTAQTPEGAVGTVDVTIVNPEGVSTVLTPGFVYTEAGGTSPTVTASLPAQGPTTGGSTIELHGTGFAPGMLAFIGGKPATEVTVVSPELATLTTPAGTTGSTTVAVTNADGYSARLDNGFAYYAPESATGPAPTLSSIVPVQGTVLGNEELFVAGANLVPGLRVYFSGRPASGITLEAARVRLLTPANKPGLARVTVTNPDGQSHTLADGFNYYVPPPVAARIDPLFGPVEGGTVVTLYGRNFTPETEVTIGGKPLTEREVLDSGTLRGRTPAGASFGYADVTVVTGSLSDTLKSGFYYTDKDHPFPGSETGPQPISVRRVVPSTGPSAGGITVNVLGDGFQQGAKVSFNGVAATDVKVLGATSITLKLPAGTVGPASVEVENPDKGKEKLDSAFNYYSSGSSSPAPRISGIAPSTGPMTGGTRAVVLGSNLAQGCKVLFGTAESPNVRFVSPSQVVVDTPAVSQPGSLPVTVINPDGKSDTIFGGFAYYVRGADQKDPVISTVTPPAGPAGAETAVVLGGQNFQQGAMVFAGELPVVSSSVTSATELAATMPAQPTGSVDVVVTNPDGLTGRLNAGFAYAQSAPKVTSLRPGKGPTAGNITVVILGEHFDRGAKVAFGRTESPDVKYVDGTALRAVVPSAPAGTVDVTVTNPDGQAVTVTGAFEYDPNWAPGPQPVVSAVQPQRGPTTGGSAVLVKGTGFVEGAVVTFADLPAADVHVIDGTTLYAVTPANSAGPAHVTVINPDGQVGVLAGGFTYADPSTLGPKPVLTGTSPTSGRETATTQTLLTGKNFRTGAFIFFGGVPAANPLMLSSTIYQADALPHAPGQVDVAITNTDGQSAILKASFTYVARPTLASVNPATGPTSGGTKVLVTGDGFQGGAEVFFGPNKATNLVVRSATLLECLTPTGTAGAVDVTVTNTDGQTSTMEGAFAFVPPPSFDATTPMLPATGPTTGGTIALIKGRDFLPGAVVTVQGKPAVTEVIDPTTIAVEMPPSAVGYADVSVTNSDGQVATAPRAFLYRDPASLGPAPSISQLTPAKGAQTGGTLLALAGGNFVDGAMVFFSLRPAADVRYVAPDSLTATTPASAATGKVVVAVTNPDGQTVKHTDGFEYLDPGTLGPAPSLAALAPQEASIFGGTIVAAGGGNFVPGAQLFFNGRPALAVTVNSATSATVVTPEGKPGATSVTLTNPDGQSATYAGAFAYIVPPPEPLVVNPNTGTARGGTPIVINGKSFQQGATVQIAGVGCGAVKVVDSTKIECITPPGVDGPANVKLTNADGQSATLANGYTYVAPPEPTRVSPTSGPESGGTQISITGSFFRTGVTVEIGNKPCNNVTHVSSALITCSVPAGLAGPAAVKVINIDGQSGVLAAGFTYLPPIPPPQIGALSPNYGSTRGGAGVTISGQSFQVGARVFFGTTQASAVTVLSGTSLSCIAPVGAVGKVDVSVENPDAQRATLPQAFEYIKDADLPPLAVRNISPNSGAQTGGTRITLTGNGFQAGLAVTIGSNQCLDLARVGPTAISCTTPASATAGKVPVAVTNPDGQQVIVQDGFAYDLGGRYVVAKQNLPLEASGDKRGILLVDVDKDNDLDVFQNSWIPSPGIGGAWLQINDGTGRFLSANSNLPTEPRYWPYLSPNALQVAAADVDKDLDVDILWMTAREILVYRNDGAGSFTRSSYPICPDSGNGIGPDTQARGFSIGDLDGDGDLDLAVARAGNSVTCWDTTRSPAANVARVGDLIMLNDGSGNFRPRYDGVPQIADDSMNVKIADFDRDGDNDLLYVNETNHQTRLYYNEGVTNGYPVFSDVSLSLLGVSGGNGRNAVVGDVEGDGDLDILIANNGQRDRLYVNDGFGKFADVTLTQRMPSDIDSTYDIFLQDYDNDGDLDLLTRRGRNASSAHPMRIYPNDGTGFFGADVAASVLPRDLNEGLSDLAFGDVNGDGYLDMIWMQEDYQNRLLINDTAGKFVRETITNTPEDNLPTEDAVVLDVDGDGDNDLATCGYRYNDYQTPWIGTAVRLYLNDGAGNFVDYTDARMPNILPSCADIDAADVDGDGDRDLLVTSIHNPGAAPSSASGASVYLLTNNGTGTFTDETYPRLPSDSVNRDLRPQTLEPIDYDGDGDLDLVVGRSSCSGGSSLRLWQNLGLKTGYFVDVSNTAGLGLPNGYCSYNYSSVGGALDIQVGDLDGDGKPDLFVTGDRNAYIKNTIFINDGDGSFTNSTASKMASAGRGYRSVLFDADKDGDLDIYLVNWDDDRLYVNTGGAIYSDVTPANLPRSGNSVGAVVADSDKDGDLDLIIAKESRAQPRILFNLGSGQYQDLTSQKIPWSNDPGRNIVKGDLNGDGDEDLFYIVLGQSRIFLNEP